MTDIQMWVWRKIAAMWWIIAYRSRRPQAAEVAMHAEAVLAGIPQEGKATSLYIPGLYFVPTWRDLHDCWRMLRRRTPEDRVRLASCARHWVLRARLGIGAG